MTTLSLFVAEMAAAQTRPSPSSTTLKIRFTCQRATNIPTDLGPASNAA
jgi:hypothetical protein